MKKFFGKSSRAIPENVAELQEQLRITREQLLVSQRDWEEGQAARAELEAELREEERDGCEREIGAVLLQTKRCKGLQNYCSKHWKLCEENVKISNNAEKWCAMVPKNLR